MQDGSVLKQAMALHRAGFSLAPILTNVTKAAAVRWRELQHRYPTLAELFGWFGGPRPFGPAIIAGAISGNLEIIDGDHAPTWLEFRTVALQRVPAMADAPLVRAPRDGGGFQWYVRCAEPVPGNLKLAIRRHDDGRLEVAIETRGEAGYVLST